MYATIKDTIRYLLLYKMNSKERRDGDETRAVYMRHYAWIGLTVFHQGGGISGALVGGISYDVFHNYQILIGIDAVLCGIAVVGYSILKLHNLIQKGELYHVG
jgi:hypothetical protein